MAKALVIVGTSSSAGKSLLVTALGRILRRKGIKVAPFKAQNMSLQSFVCKDGGEIGLAQAIQAFACQLEPESSFNPILLKPQGEGKSQVLLCGKLYKTLSASEYYQEKDKLWNIVREILDSLITRFDVLLLEGAGSPAEINLLSVDLVNIKPALYLKAPVLLVGDIDKGGVFASLYGTVELLKKYLPPYVDLIKGFIINKFRGSFEILQPGISELYKISQIPTLGIIPYMEYLPFSEEDGFSFKEKKYNKVTKEGVNLIKIVVVNLKYKSNFADFDPFLLEEDVELIYSLRKEDLFNADIIILPGTKNTLLDLKFLHQLEMGKILREALKRGAEIIGICGGFQMLGMIIKNPYGIESSIKEIKGLELLETETLFYPEKIISQVEAYSSEDPYEESPLWGFEIHNGVSLGDLNLFKIKRLATGEMVHDGRKEGQVWGTYLHGLFTNDFFRNKLLNKHRLKKGLTEVKNPPKYWETLDKNLNFLAEAIEKYLDLSSVYKLLKI